EQALLLEAFERSVDEGRCRLVTIVGPAGIGKSRLAGDVRARLMERATVLRGRCLPYGHGITFWPLAEVVSQAAGLGRAAPQESLTRILALLNGKDDAAAITEQVAKLLGLASGSSPEAFWAVRRLFEALARDRPLAVVFDDMHWAEPTFVELVEHVAERAQAPILLLCLARSELF